jgi:hypothetical protein
VSAADDRDGDGRAALGSAPHRRRPRGDNRPGDNACNGPQLAPAVALPAPRHDRRRTGAAGSPPGGSFSFVRR